MTITPLIIGISGSHSDIGKTTLASCLIKSLRNRLPSIVIGAIKFTKTAIYCAISSDEGYLNQQDKDTAILKNSGADFVLWVQSPQDSVEYIITDAIERLQHCDIIIVEGNTAVIFCKPNVIIFLKGKADKILKQSALVLQKQADFVLDVSKDYFSQSDVASIISVLEVKIMKDKIKKLLAERSKDGKINCHDARSIADELKVPYSDVGAAANEMKIKIKNCELGCF